MADFIGTVPTRYGLELLGLLGTGVTLNFTRAAVGSGVWSQEQVDSPAEMEALVNEAMSLAISPESVKPVSIPKGDEPMGMYEVSVFLTNAGLQDGFALREIGIFADHPTRGEILFAVDYAGDRSDYIPALPANAAPLEKIFKMAVLTGLAKAITVNQSPVLLATHDDIGDHNTNPEAHPDLLDRLATGTPEILFPAGGSENIGETPIYRFRQFAPVFEGTSEEAIQVQVDLETGTFANPVHDSGFLTTIAAGYEQPAGMLQAGKTKYKIRYRRRLNTGQISEWSEVVNFETRDIFNYVARPSNVSPSNGATGVMECPKLVSSPFAVVGDTADVHEATQYRMRIGDIVLHLSPELGAVVEYDFPAGLLLVSGGYVWEVRYKGMAFGWSEWSTATSFHTAAAFITGDEAISFPSWDGYDSASSAGVALADGAALRSSGVDQEAGEGDWVSYQSKLKIRLLVLIAALSQTSASELVSSTPLTEGKEILCALGRAVLSNVRTESIATTSTHEKWIDQLGAASFSGSTIIPGYGGAVRSKFKLSGDFIFEFSPTQTGQDNLGVGFIPASQLSNYSASAAPAYFVCALEGCVTYDFDQEIYTTLRTYKNGEWVYYNTDMVVQEYSPGVVVQIKRIGSTLYWYVDGKLVHTLENAITEDVYVHVGNLRGTSNQIANVNWSSTIYKADIAAAGFAAAPDLFTFMPTLTAATGAAGTAFTAADFNEIAVANATLGTDTDTDRPDFILLESEKVTPATPFRRVAIGASGLSKDSLINITETQCDTWKQGA